MILKIMAGDALEVLTNRAKKEKPSTIKIRKLQGENTFVSYQNEPRAFVMPLSNHYH